MPVSYNRVLDFCEVVLGVFLQILIFVEVGAVAVPDVAAVLTVDRGVLVDGGFDEGAHLLKRVELLVEGGKQGRLKVGGGLPDPREVGGGVGQREQLPGGDRPVDDLGHQPLEVVDALQRLDEGGPLKGLVRKFRDSGMAAGDLRQRSEGLLEVFAHQPLAHRGAGAVEDPEEGAALFMGAERLSEFQVAAGGDVDGEELLVAVAGEGPQPARAGLLGLPQVVDHRRDCVEGADAVFELQLLEILGGKLVEDHPDRLALVVLRLLDRVDDAPQPALDEIPRPGAVKKAGVYEQFLGGVFGQLPDDAALGVGPVVLGKTRLAGRDVGKAGAVSVGGVVDAGEVVVLPLGQHAPFDNGAGGGDADDLPLDHPFGGVGGLHLLADGDLIPLFDKLFEIDLAGVVGHAAHRRAVLHPAVPPGQGELKLPRGGEGVLKKHLVKIADPIKQDVVRILRLNLLILLHHRRKLTQNCNLPVACQVEKGCGDSGRAGKAVRPGRCSPRLQKISGILRRSRRNRCSPLRGSRRCRGPRRLGTCRGWR